MATNFQLELSKTEGESMVKGFEKKIELESWSWGATQLATYGVGGGGGGAKTTVHDVSFTKRMDSASVQLMAHCFDGKALDKAKLTLLKQDKNGAHFPYYVVELKNVIVSSYQVSGGGHGNELVHEACSLNFEECHVTYTPQGQDGTPGAVKTAGFNVPKNIAL